MSNVPAVNFARPPRKWTNKLVKKFLEAYHDWLSDDPSNVIWSDFCKSLGIRNPYYLRDYLMTTFTGVNGDIDFKHEIERIEKLKEDNLVKLGLFAPDKEVSKPFLIAYMKAKHGWQDDRPQTGISVTIINEAKSRLEVVDAEPEG